MADAAAALDGLFPRYREFDPAVPAWCVTPPGEAVVHRFFDTSPFSPSGRYLGLTRLPYEDRLPRPGDAAGIVVVDLETGEARTVADTRGWDVQVGAHVQWGADDSQLFFNDVDTASWRPFGVRLDPSTGVRAELGGTVYHVSPDGGCAASPSLARVGATQPGYGVVVPEGVPPADEDGIHLTDTADGRTRLLVSLREIVETAGLGDAGTFHLFHVRWSPTGERLQAVVRQLAPGRRMSPQLMTMRADGSELRVAVPASEWQKGGHHPSWCPDGEHVLMNLRLDGSEMRFVRARYDGSGLAAMSDAVAGSGHPSLHPNGRQLVTDAYPNEPVAFADGTVPIRLVDLEAGTERAVVRVPVEPAFSGPRHELRVDPHPAWDRPFRRIAFNAFLGGTRRVCIADLGGLLA